MLVLMNLTIVSNITNAAHFKGTNYPSNHLLNHKKAYCESTSMSKTSQPEKISFPTMSFSQKAICFYTLKGIQVKHDYHK